MSSYAVWRRGRRVSRRPGVLEPLQAAQCDREEDTRDCQQATADRTSTCAVDMRIVSIQRLVDPATRSRGEASDGRIRPTTD